MTDDWIRHVDSSWLDLLTGLAPYSLVRSLARLLAPPPRFLPRCPHRLQVATGLTTFANTHKDTVVVVSVDFSFTAAKQIGENVLSMAGLEPDAVRFVL